MENVRVGIKRIFTAEILALVAAVIGVASAVVLNMVKDNVTQLITALVVFASLIVALASAILYLVGIIKASKDELGFRMALWAILAGILFSLLETLFSMLSLQIVANVFSVANKVTELLAFLFVIQSIMIIASEKGREDIVTLGDKIKKIILIVYLVTIIAYLVAVIFLGVVGATVAGVASIIAAVLSVVVYVLYLVFLGKAKKMFD